MRQEVKQLEQWLRASGVYCSQVTMSTGEVVVFIHNDDCTSKRREKQVTAMAKKLGIEIKLADKGALFL